MNVAELIDKLQALPQNVKVYCVWDGEPRSLIVHAWVARNGRVMLADGGEVVYDPQCRPADAPGAEDGHWQTPERTRKTDVNDWQEWQPDE